MKKIKRASFPSAIRWLCLFWGTGVFCACSKTPVPPGAVSLTIVNTLTTSLIVNFNEQDSIIYLNRGSSQIIEWNKSLAYSLHSGSQIVNLREVYPAWPGHEWENHSLLKLQFTLPAGTIGSLFIAGTVDDPDTLFVKDVPPDIPLADSSMGIRFVNLSGAKTAVRVNLQGQPDGSEADNLPYKGVTNFRKYPANASAQSYVFEFRDPDGALLATSSIINPGTAGPPNPWRYNNFTVVFSEAPGSSPAAFIVNNH